MRGTTRHLPRSRTIRYAGVVLAIAGSLAGCHAPNAADRTPLETLHERVAQERAAAPVERVVIPPPGLRALAWTVENEDHARQSLDELLAAMAPIDRTPIPGTPPFDADAALRAYLLGVDDAVRNRHAAALIHLEEAARLDPSAPAVWRRLAQSYFAVSNPSKAHRCLQEVLRLDPADGRARIELADLASGQRDFTGALRYVAGAAPFAERFAADPPGASLAMFITHIAADHLGYDKAAIEAGRHLVDEGLPAPTHQRDGARLRSIDLQRGEIEQRIGDAEVRLGRLDAALATYRRALERDQEQVGDTIGGPRLGLIARIAWLELRRGRPGHAALALGEALWSSPLPVQSDEVELASWFVAAGGDGSALAALIAAERPAELGTAQLVTALAPTNDALRALEAWCVAHPDDLPALRQWLQVLAQRDPAAALDRAASVVDRAPMVADAVTDQLRLALPRPIELMRGTSSDPGTAALRIRLWLDYWHPGEAWRRVRAARQRWPAHVGLRQLEWRVLAELDDIVALRQRVAGAAPTGWDAIAAVRALRHAGAMDDAIELLATINTDDVDDVADGPGDADLAVAALLEHARLMVAKASQAPEGAQASWIDRAIEAADQARLRAPSRREAWHLLAGVYSVGPRANPRAFTELVRELRTMQRDVALEATLLAGLEMRRGRYDSALERALAAVENSPGDDAALSVLLAIWDRRNDAAAARDWLREQLAISPHEPRLHDHLARLELAHDLAGTTESRMRARLAEDPDDPIAAVVLELLGTARGDHALALEFGRPRLDARPPSGRRAIQRAALLERAGRRDAALDDLRWIVMNMPRVSREQMQGAIVIAAAIEHDAAAARVVVDLISAAADHFDALALGLYAIGVRSAAQLDDTDLIDQLAERAATSSRGADDTSLDGAIPWAQFAQRLIDARAPNAMARTIRARLEAHPIYAPGALTILVNLAVVAEAAGAHPAAERADRVDDLLRDLDRRGLLSSLAVGMTEVTLADARDWAARIFTVAGDFATADELLVRAARDEPTHAMVRNNLGYQRVEDGDASPQVAAWIEAAAEALPDDPNVVDTIGWLRYKQGRFEDADGIAGALSLLQRAVRLATPPGPEVLLHLGDAQWRVGSKSEATATWRRLLEAHATRAVISQRRAQYRQLQAGTWGVEIVDPEELYHREFGALLDGARARLDAVTNGREPDVALTFEELNHRRESSAETR